MADPDLAALREHRFPGGTATVERWENWLLTDCTQRTAGTSSSAGDGDSDVVHPVAMFHVPLRAVGVTIAELFALGGAAPIPGAVTLLGYDWHFDAPLREGVAYTASGGVSAAVRELDADGAVRFDDIDFAVDLAAAGGSFVARAVNHWRFRRAAAPHPSEVPAVVTGTTLPALTVTVDAQRMKTMAALLRDPYPIHWDPAASIAAGFDGRPVNQGPLNASYIANMLTAWAGATSLRRLSVRFHGRAFAGDTVEAGGALLDTSSDASRHRECTVWLDRVESNGTRTRLVSGTASITG